MDYLLQGPVVPSIVSDTFQVSFLENLNADDAYTIAEYSTDLETWIQMTSTDLVSIINQGDGTTMKTYQTPLPPSTEARQFVRLRLVER